MTRILAWLCGRWRSGRGTDDLYDLLRLDIVDLDGVVRKKGYDVWIIKTYNENI